ncbi:MAG: DUF58 domain-containing protein [Tepidisphaeraceae bacterium]
MAKSPGQPDITPIRRKPTFDFSLTGLVYCGTMLLMGVAAINGQANLLFGVFGLMIGVLLVSGIICRMVLRQLKVTRTLPELCTVGEPATAIYKFQNQKKYWPSLSVTLSELEGARAFERPPSVYLLHAAAGMTASVPMEFVPARRGKHQLGHFQLSTSFPFGFIRRAFDRAEPDALLVCPPLGRVSRQLLGLCRTDQRDNAPVKPRPGGQDEFYGVKEHRQGDNPRWIYWRRTARTPGLMVSKEMTQVAPPRLMLLVDTYLAHPTREDLATVEKTLAMAASLASQGLEEGLAVGLCAWDRDDWAILPPLQGKRQRRDVLAALARLPRNSVVDSRRLLDASSGLIKSGTTGVLFTPRAMEVSLTDRLRGAMVVVATLSPSANAWFTFDSHVDFEQCIPLEEDSPANTHGQAEPKRARWPLEFENAG